MPEWREWLRWPSNSGCNVGWKRGEGGEIAWKGEGAEDGKGTVPKMAKATRVERVTSVVGVVRVGSKGGEGDDSGESHKGC